MDKIYGIYTGGVDVSNIDNLHEIDIWKKIEIIGGSIFWANHDCADGRINLTKSEVEKLEEMQYLLEYLVYYTRKFGVKFNREPKVGEHVERSEDYNAWFQFWNNHVQGWTNEESNQFIETRKNGKDFSKFLPKTNWKGEPIDNSLNI